MPEAHDVQRVGYAVGLQKVVVEKPRRAAGYRSASQSSRTAVSAPPHQHILFWGGLRGALALVLGLPASVPMRDTIVTVAFGVVAFSIIGQGLTMTPLLRRLKLIGADAEGDAASPAPDTAS